MDPKQFLIFMEEQRKMNQAIIDSLQNGAGRSANNQINQGENAVPVSAEQRMDTLANSISVFSYNEENNIIFESWYSRHEDIFLVDANQLDDASKVRLLLRKLDANAHNRYTNFILPKNPRENNFEDTVKVLKEICGKNMSLFARRYRCLQIEKSSCDDYIAYAGLVNKQCEEFQLTTLSADHLKCLIFVCGLKSSHEADIRTKLLSLIESKPDITINALTTECTRLLNLKHDTAMVGAKMTTIQKIHSNATNKPKYPCWLCGDWHFTKECSYTSHKCKDCNKIGHKEGFCSNKKNNSERSSSISNKKHNPETNAASFNKKKNQFSRKSSTSNSKSIFFVSEGNINNRKYASVVINNVPVKLQIDSASDITIISTDIWKKIGSPLLNATSHSAKNASQQKLTLTAELTCNISFHNSIGECTIYVSNVPDLNIMGIDLIELFGLWDVPINSICNAISSQSSLNKGYASHVQQRFYKLFSSELGLCNRSSATLYLKEGSRSIFRPKRPVPLASLKSVEIELDRLEAANVLSKVNYSDWAAPIVAVKKANGSIRICGDFSTGLNDCLELHQYPLPHPDNIFATLNGGKYFSKIDFADAYLQVPVEEKSKPLLTINTHRGLYRYNRLPFGIKSAPGIFQQIIDVMLADLPGVVGYIDDIIVVGKSEIEHDQNYIMYLHVYKIGDFSYVLTNAYLKCEKLNILALL